ncbi:MAG: HAMP domain-containing histidine kinase [Deltaproteobacteria bacterium]|nr:MAG: HAMP domain-containing histidine kinase [Deltaproteobacteria bacterium]
MNHTRNGKKDDLHKIIKEVTGKVLRPEEVDELASVLQDYFEQRVQASLKTKEIKGEIAECISTQMRKREVVKMKQAFVAIIAALRESTDLRSCALFSVTGGEKLTLVASYPPIEGEKEFALPDAPPLCDLMVSGGATAPPYILLEQPREDLFCEEMLRNLLGTREVNAIAGIPLLMGGRTQYLVTFHALEGKRGFTKDDGQIFTFLGNELTKLMRIERLEEVVHDLRGHAIAADGFARRVKRMLEETGYDKRRKRVDQGLEVIIEETERIQDLALSLYEEGEQQKVNVTKRLLRRFQISQEIINELRLRNIRLAMGELDRSLWIRCIPLQLERVFSNLLDNAINALREEGGELRIKSYREMTWACVEVTNTGVISEDKRREIEGGTVKGIGLGIIQRLVQNMGGTLQLRTGEGFTTFRIFLPLVEQETRS